MDRTRHPTVATAQVAEVLTVAAVTDDHAAEVDAFLGDRGIEGGRSGQLPDADPQVVDDLAARARLALVADRVDRDRVGRGGQIIDVVAALRAAAVGSGRWYRPARAWECAAPP